MSLSIAYEMRFFYYCKSYIHTLFFMWIHFVFLDRQIDKDKVLMYHGFCWNILCAEECCHKNAKIWYFRIWITFKILYEISQWNYYSFFYNFSQTFFSITHQIWVIVEVNICISLIIRITSMYCTCNKYLAFNQETNTILAEILRNWKKI